MSETTNDELTIEDWKRIAIATTAVAATLALRNLQLVIL